jgi:hypothetical protein
MIVLLVVVLVSIAAIAFSMLTRRAADRWR